MNKDLVEKYQNSLLDEEESKCKDFFVKLTKTFPKIWSVENFPSKRLPVGPGWHRLLWVFTEEIEELNNSIKLVAPKDCFVKVDYMKEKFGELRLGLHINGEKENFQIPKEIRDRAWEIAALAERQSNNICEACSMPGKRRFDFPEIDVRFGWVKTYCDDCWYEQAELRACGRYYNNANSAEAKKIRKWFHNRKKDFMIKVDERVRNSGI